MSGPFELFHRGFFCDDESLKQPYTEQQTVTSIKAALIWTGCFATIIILVELLRSLAERQVML